MLQSTEMCSVDGRVAPVEPGRDGDAVKRGTDRCLPVDILATLLLLLLLFNKDTTPGERDTHQRAGRAQHQNSPSHASTGARNAHQQKGTGFTPVPPPSYGQRPRR